MSLLRCYGHMRCESFGFGCVKGPLSLTDWQIKYIQCEQCISTQSQYHYSCFNNDSKYCSIGNDISKAGICCWTVHCHECIRLKNDRAFHTNKQRCKSATQLHLQRWIYSAFRLSSCASSNKAHFIIMALCHSGLKALVINNYSTGKEHGRIQNKDGVRGAGWQLLRKQVCAMNYTSGEMPPYFKWMHFRLSFACSCLQSQSASC